MKSNVIPMAARPNEMAAVQIHAVPRAVNTDDENTSGTLMNGNTAVGTRSAGKFRSELPLLSLEVFTDPYRN